jgi:hypothetical protein
MSEFVALLLVLANSLGQGLEKLVDLRARNLVIDKLVATYYVAAHSDVSAANIHASTLALVGLVIVHRPVRLS